MEEQSHHWLGIPLLIRACLSWVSPSQPSHSTALNYGSASGAREGLVSALWLLAFKSSLFPKGSRFQRSAGVRRGR